jgi:hypothetical protein
VAAQASVYMIRQALIDVDLTERGIRPARPIAELEREARLLRDLWVRCDYAGAGQIIPPLLRELHTSAGGPDKPAALRALVDATFVASSTVRHLGHPAEAWLGAERCRDAAEELEDPVLIGLAAIARVQAAAASGSYERSLSTAVRAATDLQAHTELDGSLEVTGTLHLASANACRALRRPGDSATWIGEASELADRTGDTTDLWLWFGPTNLGLWRISMETDGGDPGRAVSIARSTDPAVIPAHMRQVAYHCDVARALAHTRNDREAIRHLLLAERAAPQYVHSSALVQETTRALLERSQRRAAGVELRGLAERMGVVA